MGRKITDIIIIGAGPAGSIAAKKIGDEGYSVSLYEKDHIPRHKHCAGYVSPRSVKILKLAGIDCSSVIRQQITGFKINCMGEYYDFTPQKSDGISGNVMREEFDTFLTECARESGAKILDSTKVTGIKKMQQGYSVISTSGNERCDIVIGADGVNSFTRKYLEIVYDKKKIGVALETEIPVDQDVFDFYDSMNFYNMGSYDCGYSWVFPKVGSGTINAGICVWVNEAKKMNGTLMEMLYSFLRSLEWYQNQKIEPHGHLIPFMGTVKKLGKGNIILIGDAAGFVGVAGEGIPYALESGLNASDSIRKYYDGDGTLLELYETKSKDMVNYLNWFIPQINKIMFSEKWLKHILRMTERDTGFRNDLIELMAHSMSIKDVYDTLSVQNMMRAALSRSS